ncbi:MAG: hypothetical protein KAQ92_06900 [Candidatus Aenigmarchaeota archaeon]|nr:hypothetical protein [Candidatus Aenigmarchaeota archaeon]
MAYKEIIICTSIILLILALRVLFVDFRKSKNKKYIFLFASLRITRIAGFMLGMIFSFLFIFNPFYFEIWTEIPTSILAMFIVLPPNLMMGFIISFMFLGIGMIVWKPFLTQKEVEEYFYKQFHFAERPTTKEIKKLSKILRKEPYMVVPLLLLILFFLSSHFRISSFVLSILKDNQSYCSIETQLKKIF